MLNHEVAENYPNLQPNGGNLLALNVVDMFRLYSIFKNKSMWTLIMMPISCCSYVCPPWLQMQPTPSILLFIAEEAVCVDDDRPRRALAPLFPSLPSPPSSRLSRVNDNSDPTDSC